MKNAASREWDRLWLQQAILVQNPTVALDLSIKALAFTRLGWLKHDNALTTRGTMLYGHALRELQKALWDERMMWLDETLAAAYSLSVYEVSNVKTIYVHNPLIHDSFLRLRLALSKVGIRIFPVWGISSGYAGLVGIKHRLDGQYWNHIDMLR